MTAIFLFFIACFTVIAFDNIFLNMKTHFFVHVYLLLQIKNEIFLEIF